MNIPQIDNPEHIDNLGSIALLKAQGFYGNDASLRESLFEYGLVWRVLNDEILFIYRHPSLEGRFDRCTIASDTDAKREWNWAFKSDRAEGFYSFLGITSDEWDKLPLPCKVSDLISYYGIEEIFGSSYWEGFSIES